MDRKFFSIFTGQGYISKVIVRPQVSEGVADVLLKVFPVETDFVRGGHPCSLLGELI